MIYEQVNSKLLIGRVFEDRAIDYSGFLPRVPNWIHQAMRKLRVPTSMLSVISDGTVSSYKCAIPSDCKILDGVSYLGYRLNRTDKINTKVTDVMPNLVHDEYTYELDNNGYIITTFEECDSGELKFYYRKLPVELDTTTNLYFPLIPNNEDLIDALGWYILKKILERGHKVGQYSLAVNNIYLNPAMAWDKHKKVARNSMLALDSDDRYEISNMIRTFLYNKNYHTDEQFNNQYTE